MDLTIIIACKDRSHNLAYCLASIDTCHQTPNVIIIDFGSKKNLKHLENKYAWLSVITVTRNTKIFHKARALNIGIKAAKTEYVCLTDVDQIFQPNFFDVILNTLKTHKKAFIRCKTYFLPDLPNHILPNNISNSMYFKILALTKKTMIKDPHGEGCCHGAQRCDLMAIRGHDEAYIGWGFEDKDLAFRLRCHGIKTIWIDALTSIVHLPHQRDKIYFSYKLRKANEDRYYNKIKDIQIQANTIDNWGRL